MFSEEKLSQRLYWSEYNQLFIGFALSSLRLVVSIQRYFSLYIKLRHFIVFYIDKLPLHKNDENSQYV